MNSRPYPDVDLTSPPLSSSSSQESRPYPTMPYPGFSNGLYDNSINISSDSLANKLQNRERPNQQPIPNSKTSNSIASQESFQVPRYDQFSKVNGRTESLKSSQYSIHSGSSNEVNQQQVPITEVINDISKLKINNEQVPENISHFNKLKNLAIKDYSKNEFSAQIQLDWVKALFESTADPEFMKSYNINGEKLSRVLNESEAQKNEHIFIKQAIKILKKICTETQNAEAFFILGSLYSNSDALIKLPRFSILNKNYEKSFKYYEKAANSGHLTSIYRLAVSYELGIGVSKNYSKSFQYFEKAADLGSVPSMFKLGVVYLKGLLKIPRNARESFQWFNKASRFATQENPHALYELGKFYEYDLLSETAEDLKFNEQLTNIISKDDETALNYYRQAAKLNYSPAQFKLGWCYEYGKLNCVIDAKKSIGWYSRSAKQGNFQSEMALSGWYLTGAKGILESNDKEAFLWANKSAESGFIKAEYALGYFYEVGLGCTVDLEESRKYYLRAASKGHEKAIEKLKKWNQVHRR
ncbi:hypothetical protein WICMUC_002646 [Wickerhamomyces mucosus]|uniref:Activator of C kinase protein 1 n=1 Tax=Wickerhamomyces mucosus TaxID=1378264 RepID=A0A9P8PNU8_9ASCO|nr:hypothetical protein WICMUC_002646 [Wickerhamomyces mucosus]